MEIERGYKFRFYPTTGQQIQLAQTFGCCRVVYNRFLQIRTDGWYKEQRRISYTMTAAMLKELKTDADFAWLNEVSSVCLQQSLRHLDKAFVNFFKHGADYPKFKKRHLEQSAKYAKNAFIFDREQRQLTLAKQADVLNICWHRTLPKKAEITSIVVSKDRSDRYFISFQVKEKIKPKSVSPRTVGIDLGINEAVIPSYGKAFSNPQYYRRSEQRLAKAQRLLSRKQKGSNNRKKTRLKVARLHAKIADQRRDFNHKLTTQLVNENQVISMETLAVKNMLKNGKLAKSISDVAWGQIGEQLGYKAQWAGRTLIKIDRWFPSSKRCNDCGHIVDKLPLSVREWDCPACGTHHHRDRNAAINIDLEGKAILAGSTLLRTHE